jgi:murein DD-endopeptidase MepM/ murein hydrolase activator NlpD/uncharacterized protein YgiM (DUF1202 family)
MTPVKTGFLPAKKGFRFPNSFVIHFPVNYQIPFVGPLSLQDIFYGLCGGMSFAALDYFHAGAIVPSWNEVDQIDPKLFSYLCERQLDSLSVPVVLQVIQWMLLEDRAIASRMTRVEIPKLRRMLDHGEPAVLALIRVQGAGNPTNNHQVVAVGYEAASDAKGIKIFLYDPNHPSEDPVIDIQYANRNTGMQVTQSTGEPLRGFFMIPYAPRKTFPVFLPTPATLAFGIEETGLPFRLKWPVDSRRVNQFFGENPDSYKPFGLPGHEGLDLFALSGANVYAAADGEVYEAGQPKGHPYGLHVRIKHAGGGKTFRTVYAHLSKTLVQVGQVVKAGDMIGLADNTGNSFGVHLHLTLKIDGEQTPGYPGGIVDPWPYLKGAVIQPGGFTVYTAREANLLSQPLPGASSLAILPAGEALIVLGDAGSARASIGKQGAWLQVQTAAGETGYVAGELVQDTQQAFPPSDLVIYAFDTVNLRSGPGTAFNLLASLTMNDPLTVLGNADTARAKIGKAGEWILVQAENGICGFVAAWLVHTTGHMPAASGVVVYPLDVLNVRARPSIDANILTVVSPGDALFVLGDKAQVQGMIGQMNQWLNVSTPGKFAGYVAAWMVRVKGQASPTPLPPPIPASLIVYPTADINVRAQASVNSPRVSGAFHKEALQVVEADLNAAREKIGKTDQWIYIQKKDNSRGWVAAWFVSAAPL